MGDESDEERERRRPEPPPVEFVKSGDPAAPMPPRDQPPAAWVPRPEDYRMPQPAPGAWPAPGDRKNRAILGGVLLILSGLTGFAGSYILFTQPLTPGDLDLIQNMTSVDLAENALLVTGIMYAQAFAILGGVMAIQRKNWKLSIVCAVIALGNFGFFPIGSLLSFIGLFLISTSRQSFLG